MEKNMKLPIAAPVASRERQTPRSLFWRRCLAAAGFTFGLWTLYTHGDTHTIRRWCTGDVEASAPQCPQPDPIWPSRTSEKLDEAFKYISSKEFANASITRLQGAVRIPTESYDDLGAIGEDPRYDVFFKFADYLETAYPLIHDKLKVEKINTHGLLYTWEGSDRDLKPILLMAHQDVVPVPDDTVDQWTHPPYDAVFDGTYIWGRGANDCKNQLTALMETLELLLSASFAPERTILLSFGFDEESSGMQGAGHLSAAILSRYGAGGVEAILDEGEGYAEVFGRGFAMPAVAEKGYIDVDITVRTPGGHSSIPADHTSIGILAEVISALESTQYDTYLAADNPYLSFLRCGAEHAPDFPKKLRKLLRSHRPASPSSSLPSHRDHHHHHHHHDPLATAAASLLGREVRYLMQTSQAVDIISGGSKVNALPERAWALVDHRVNIGDSPATVRARLSALVGPIARAHNLSASLFDEGDGPAPANGIALRARASELEVAPVTPTDATRHTPYRVLAGTVRGVFGEEGEGEVVVAPGLSTGNTDTRFYWDLTRHIFRFQPGMVGEVEPGLGNIHTIDERISAANHVKSVKWLVTFVRNFDEFRIEE